MAAAVTPPLTLGEILDRTIQLYRRNFLLFVGISLAPSACYVLTYGSVSLYFTSHAKQLQATGAGTPNMQVIFTFLGILAAFLFLGLPLLAAISSLSLGALNFAASLRNRQQPVTLREAYAYAFKKFWRNLGIFTLQLLFAGVIPGAAFGGVVVIAVIGAALLRAAGSGNPAFAALVGIFVVLLVVALFVVMVLIWLRFSLAFPASFIEDLKIWPAMQRSNRLSKGSRGRIFVMYLLVAVLIFVLYYALTLPVDLVLGLIFFKNNQLAALLSKPPLVVYVINLFVSFLQRAFALPIYAIALVLFYNDQRTRQEGYDIELLMAQAGWLTTPPTVPPASIPGVPAWGAVEAGTPTEAGAPGPGPGSWGGDLASETWASAGSAEPVFTDTKQSVWEQAEQLKPLEKTAQSEPASSQAVPEEAGAFRPVNTASETRGALAPSLSSSDPGPSPSETHPSPPAEPPSRKTGSDVPPPPPEATEA